MLELGIHHVQPPLLTDDKTVSQKEKRAPQRQHGRLATKAGETPKSLGT